MADLQGFLRRIPKVELHCHLLGTVRKATMKAMAARNGARTTEEQIEGFYIRGEKPVGVLAIFREMEAHILKTPADFRQIACDYLEDAAAHTVRYAEIYWNPTGNLRHTGLSYGELQAAVLAGMADAERDFGISSNLIPSIDREAPPEDAVEMVGLMIANRDPRVPGIGIDYREVDNPPEKFAEAYALARDAGFRLTAHAGEFGEPWTNVAAALDLLGVERLDHAYTVLDNPELTARCAAEGIVITVVPSNSYYLRDARPRRMGADAPHPAHGAGGAPHPSQYRRPRLPPHRPHPLLAEHGRRFRLCARRPPGLHAERARRRLDRRRAARALEAGMERRVRPPRGRARHRRLTWTAPA